MEKTKNNVYVIDNNSGIDLSIQKVHLDGCTKNEQLALLLQDPRINRKDHIIISMIDKEEAYNIVKAIKEMFPDNEVF